MKAMTPIVPGLDLPVTDFAKGQEQYTTLPAWKSGDEFGTVLSRWRLTWWERLKLLCTGDLYVWLLTFDMPLQPIAFSVGKRTIKAGDSIYDEAIRRPSKSSEKQQ